MPATLLLFAALTGAIPPIVALNTDYDYPIQVWYLQTVSRIFLGIAFCILGWKAKSLSNNFAVASGCFMAPIIVLHIVNDIIILEAVRSGDPVDKLLPNVVYPTLLALASLVAVAFGIAVNIRQRAAWASILIVWGLCGLLEAVQSHTAKIDTTTAPLADKVLIMQNVILLTAAIVMYRPSWWVLVGVCAAALLGVGIYVYFMLTNLNATVLGDANVRNGPSSKAQILTTVRAGEVVDIACETGGWARLESPYPGGYIWLELLKPNRAPDPC